jgi:hypothetical protein
MRRLVEGPEGRWAAFGALVVVVVAGIYDRWMRRRPASAPRELVVNAGVIALGGGTVTVVGSAAGTHGRQ